MMIIIISILFCNGVHICYCNCFFFSDIVISYISWTVCVYMKVECSYLGVARIWSIQQHNHKNGNIFERVPYSIYFRMMCIYIYIYYTYIYIYIYNIDLTMELSDFLAFHIANSICIPLSIQHHCRNSIKYIEICPDHCAVIIIQCGPPSYK